MVYSHKNHRLEPVAQLEPNFGGMVLGWPPTKIVSGDPDFHCLGHLGRRAEPPDIFLEENHPMTISSKFSSY
jgi:hypothetical protein